MQRYIFKEDLLRFQSCARKAWYGLGEGNNSKDPDPFLDFLGEEARSVKRASLALFEEVRRTSGSLGERLEQTKEFLDSENDLVLFEPRLQSGVFVGNPTYLIRRKARLYVLQVAAKSGDETVHREGKMLITYYGNVRSEWRELVQSLGFFCELLCLQYPGVTVSPWLLLPSANREIGERELSFALDSNEQFSSSVDEVAVNQRRSDSVLRFFDAGEAVSLIQGDVVHAMRELKTMVARNKAPEPVLRYACRNCEYKNGKDGDGFSQCWGKLAKPSPHLFELHQLYSLKNGNGLLADRKILEGRTSLFDVLEEELKGRHRARQQLQLDCSRSGEEWVDPHLLKEIANLEWPVRFIDFETYQSALPFIEGVKPFELIPFQWSCHTLDSKGKLGHEEWLHSGKGDPRREFVATLRDAVGDSGSLLIYTDYEIQVLDTLMRYFVEIGGNDDSDVVWIDALLRSGRIVDQHEWVMKRYCHPIMGGRTSLKKALPAAWLSSDGLGADLRFFEYFLRGENGELVEPYLTLPEIQVGGKLMSIREGCGAMKGYRELTVGVGATDAIAREVLRCAMLAYCKLDTAAQVILFEHWCRSLGLCSQNGNKKTG